MNTTQTANKPTRDPWRERREAYLRQPYEIVDSVEHCGEITKIILRGLLQQTYTEAYHRGAVETLDKLQGRSDE
jgi:hypothetical protein